MSSSRSSYADSVAPAAVAVILVAAVLVAVCAESALDAVTALGAGVALPGLAAVDAAAATAIDAIELRWGCCRRLRLLPLPLHRHFRLLCRLHPLLRTGKRRRAAAGQQAAVQLTA